MSFLCGCLDETLKALKFLTAQLPLFGDNVLGGKSPWLEPEVDYPELLCVSQAPLSSRSSRRLAEAVCPENRKRIGSTEGC